MSFSLPGISNWTPVNPDKPDVSLPLPIDSLIADIKFGIVYLIRYTELPKGFSLPYVTELFLCLQLRHILRLTNCHNFMYVKTTPYFLQW